MTIKTRDASKDFNRLAAAGNKGSLGRWSDGTTMWVSNFFDRKVYAYTAASNCHVVPSPVGLGVKAATATSLRIYPNPSTDQFTIYLDDPFTGHLQIRVLDLYSR